MTERRPRAGSRRFASVLMLVVSCVALLATSQPPEESRLTSHLTLTTRLTDAAPRAVGTVVLDLSAEALPVPTGQMRDVRGAVHFMQPYAGGQPVVLSVSAGELPIAPRQESGEVMVDIAQLCRVAEPCHRELAVTLDWLDPAPGSAADVQLGARVEIVYDGVIVNPTGATASFKAGTALGPADPGPQVRADTPEELIILGADQWAASRHIVLAASPEAREGEILAFLNRQIGQAEPHEVLISIVPDDNGGELLLEPFDPFETCPRRGACEPGFTIRFELPMRDAGMGATISWSFGVRASFPEADEVPAGAELSAKVDASADAGTGSPLVEATASGTLPAPDLSGDQELVRQSVTILVHAGDAALPFDAFGRLPPPATATLTVRGAVAARVYVSVRSDQEPEAYEDRQLDPSAAEVSLSFNPLRGCDVGRACTRHITLDVNLARPSDGTDPAPVTWEFNVALAYPELTSAPPLAEIEVTSLPGQSYR